MEDQVVFTVRLVHVPCLSGRVKSLYLSRGSNTFSYLSNDVGLLGGESLPGVGRVAGYGQCLRFLSSIIFWEVKGWVGRRGEERETEGGWRKGVRK